MKHLLINLTLLCMISSCTPDKTQVAEQAEVRKTICVQVQDMSLSTKDVTYYDSSTARQLFYGIAGNGGGVIKLIRVCDNSMKQDVLTFTVPAIDTENTDDVKNIYLRARTLAANKEKLSAFTVAAEQELARYIKESCKPPTSKYSDLQNCLTLAKQTLAQNIYDSTYRKVLLIGSDMKSDPQNNRHAPLEPVEFSNTEVILIRPVLSEEELQTVFPDVNVHICTTPIDAVAMICNTINNE